MQQVDLGMMLWNRLTVSIEITHRVDKNVLKDEGMSSVETRQSSDDVTLCYEERCCGMNYLLI